MSAPAAPEASAPAPPATPARARREAVRGEREAVLAFLRGEAPPAGGPVLSPEALHHALLRMIDDAPEAIEPVLRRQAADARTRERWAGTLPERVLARLTRVLGPRQHTALLQAAEVLEEAWRGAAPAGHPGVRERGAFWDFLLGFLARRTATDRLVERLAVGFFADRARRCRGLSPVPDLPPVGAALLEGAAKIAVARGNGALRGALHRQRARLLAAWDPSAPAEPPPRRRPAPAPRPARRPSRRRSRSHEVPNEEEPMYVSNAGVVLAAPFLPHLFRASGLLAGGEGGVERMRDAAAASRAVHLLQLLVDGRADTPEPELTLNKVLCGLSPADPVDAAIEPTPEERALCDQLLAAMLAAWTALSGTSAAGLRETFLRREGRLEEGEAGCRLTVQRKTVDVLVDQVPWSVSVVAHPWMPAPLYVTW
jgi:hypothetical protein